MKSSGQDKIEDWSCFRSYYRSLHFCLGKDMSCHLVSGSSAIAFAKLWKSSLQFTMIMIWVIRFCFVQEVHVWNCFENFGRFQSRSSVNGWGTMNWWIWDCLERSMKHWIIWRWKAEVISFYYHTCNQSVTTTPQYRNFYWHMCDVQRSHSASVSLPQIHWLKHCHVSFYN